MVTSARDKRGARRARRVRVILSLSKDAGSIPVGATAKPPQRRASFIVPQKTAVAIRTSVTCLFGQYTLRAVQTAVERSGTPIIQPVLTHA
jgi:hypothetical protein